MMKEKKCVCADRRSVSEACGHAPFRAAMLIEGTFYARRVKGEPKGRFFIKKSLFFVSKKEKSY